LTAANRTRTGSRSTLNKATVSVVVPTYGRPDLLRRCVNALHIQTRSPDETIIVVRSSDAVSRSVVNEQARTGITLVEVEEPGVLAALRAGVACSAGDVVLFTDDDAEPRPDWLERLLALLEGEGVGAAGGRDVVPGQTEPRRSDVGRVTRYGKLVGNHHLGVGPAREVELLKGVNMGLRAECLALPLPGVLRGDGAEVHFEVLCTRWAKQKGWRIVYDPSIEVEHVGAERIGLDLRSHPAPAAVRDAAHNLLVATTALDRARLLRQASYALALGSRDAPGIGRGAVALFRGEREVLRRLVPSIAGSLLGVARVVSTLRAPLMTTCAELRTGQKTGLKVA
jgi:hypothetical protein